jgi:subtilisin family serine protease
VDRPLPVDFGTKIASDIPPSPECPPDSGSCSHRKRDGTVLMQVDARDELRVISQARGALFSQLPGYAYDSRGGRGITVYVIDTGINPNHEVRVTHYQESIRPHSFPGIQKYVGKHTLALSTR